jgi:hypothetical protein
MFCTLQEAAQTLHASEDQINALVERGILPEFREGPHRLLREADIDVLDLLRERSPESRKGEAASTEEEASSARPSNAPTASPRRTGKRRARRHVQRKLSPAATAVARPSHAQGKKNRRLRTEDRRTPEDRRPRTENREPRTEDRSPSSVPSAPSVRQWFWMGLVQDRLTAIALLAGLVLLGLSALVAGICLVAERL